MTLQYSLHGDAESYCMGTYCHREANVIVDLINSQVIVEYSNLLKEQIPNTFDCSKVNQLLCSLATHRE